MLGRSRWGEENSPRRVLTVLWLWRLAGTVPCTSKKNSGPAAASAEITRVQLPWSGAILLLYSLFLTEKAFPAWELEPATDATSTDRLTRAPGQHARASQVTIATVKNGTEDRWMDDTLSPKPVTVAYTNRRGRGTVREQPSGLVTRFPTRILPGPAAPDPGSTSTSPTVMCLPGVPSCNPLHQPRSAERRPAARDHQRQGPPGVPAGTAAERAGRRAQ